MCRGVLGSEVLGSHVCSPNMSTHNQVSGAAGAVTWQFSVKRRVKSTITFREWELRETRQNTEASFGMLQERCVWNAEFKPGLCAEHL